MQDEFDDDLTDDALTDRVRVWQRRRGHRYSVDDVVTAWVAVRARPDVRAYLDLGCGIGSVLLMVVDRARPRCALGIEAQATSIALARRNVLCNAFDHSTALHHGDLRDPASIARAFASSPAGFDLVTGTPPYKPAGSATVSPDSQRAHARVELRGGVEAYLRAAAAVLAPAGVFVMCAEAALDARVAAGAAAAGLSVVARLDVVPMAGRKGRLFSVFSCARAYAVSASPSLRAEQLVLRDAEGARTAAARELRLFFGLATSASELPSPARVRVQRSSLS